MLQWLSRAHFAPIMRNCIYVFAPLRMCITKFSCLVGVWQRFHMLLHTHITHIRLIKITDHIRGCLVLHVCCISEASLTEVFLVDGWIMNASIIKSVSGLFGSLGNQCAKWSIDQDQTICQPINESNNRHTFLSKHTHHTHLTLLSWHACMKSVSAIRNDKRRF